MRQKIIKNLISITIITLFISAFLVFLTGPVFASSTDGTIDSTYKYVWGENIGWINFGTSNGNVHITDSGLSGYALGENIGWIYLGDITNDGQGNLSGYAWGENVGWIKFNPTNGGVIINSSGEFTGSALGENIGWIIFDCSTSACVKTDWRPRSDRPACNNSSDDDGDGKIDYPNDPGCESLIDTDENAFPSIAITSTSQTTNGTRYATINYTLTDADANTCSLVNYEYSTDNNTWHTMTEKAGANSNGVSLLNASSGGTAHNFMWDIGTDLADTEDSTVYIRLKPNDGMMDGSFAISDAFAIDAKNPTIGSVSAPTTSITSSASAITWTTNETASSQVQYGPSTAYGSSTAEADTETRVASHTVNLSSLVSCIKYYYRTISKDSNGNSTTSSQSSFTTTGCIAQATPTQEQVETIDKDVGGTVSVSNITVSVPALATAVNTVFQVKELNRSATESTTSKPSETLQPVGTKTYEVKALADAETAVQNFDQPISITLNYTDSDVAGIIESTLKIYRYSSQWSQLSSCSVNQSANSVTCSTNQFSLFAIFGNPQAGPALMPTYAGGSNKKISKDKVSINGNAKYTYNPEIILTLESETADLMLISNQADFKDTSFEKFQTTKQWTLANPDQTGKKTVYIKFRDKNGALSNLYTAKIELIKPVELESAITIKPQASSPYQPDDEVLIKLNIQNKSPYQVKINSINITVPHATKAKTQNTWQDQTIKANSAIIKELIIKINYPLLESIVQTSTNGAIEYQETDGAVKTAQTDEALIELTSSKIIGKIKGIKKLTVYAYYQDVIAGTSETDENGIFVISGLKSGDYTLYSNKTKPIKITLSKSEIKKDIQLEAIPIEQAKEIQKQTQMPPGIKKQLEELPSIEAPKPETEMPETPEMPAYEGITIEQALPELPEIAKQIDILTPKFELAEKPKLDLKYLLPDLPAPIEQIVKNKAEINQNQVIVGDSTGRIEIPQIENQIRLGAVRLVKLYLKLARPAKSIKTTVIFEKQFKIAEYVFNDDNEDGIFEAEIKTPQIAGTYILKTEIDDLEPQTLTMLIDPEGYIYTLDKQKREVRIKDAIIALWKYDLQTGNYLFWQAQDFKQQNPQSTQKDGRYSFLVPSGKYYLTVSHPDFEFKKTDVFETAEAKEVHLSIELKEKSRNLLGIMGIIPSACILGILIILTIIAFEFIKKRKS
ncbi:MAG: hypothetical protein ABH896_01405 [Candidatus Jacksonbacteria bacterium]